jgi:hypothetical protein
LKLTPQDEGASILLNSERSMISILPLSVGEITGQDKQSKLARISLHKRV